VIAARDRWVARGVSTPLLALLLATLALLAVARYRLLAGRCVFLIPSAGGAQAAGAR